MSNNFSTSSGVMSLCTKISGKYSSLAMPYQNHKEKTPSSIPFRFFNATEKEYRRTISSSSAEAFALPTFGILSTVSPVLSLDELIARLARSPMGTASSGMGRSLSQRACLVRLVYLPSPTTHDVAARGSEIPAPRPTHPTAPRFYQHVFQAGTDLTPRKGLGESRDFQM